MKIAIGSDHGGFALKEDLISYLNEKKIEIIDCGCYTTERVDYPIFAKEVAKKVQNEEVTYGVLICTTGIGMSICANKYKKIRAALVTNSESAHLTRQHNNSNIICLGAKFTTLDDAKEYVDIFLNETFMGERHTNRVKMIEEAENER